MGFTVFILIAVLVVVVAASCRAVGGTTSGDHIVTGQVIASGGFTSSTATITPAMMTSVPRSIEYAQDPGSAVVAETRDIHILKGTAATISAIQAAITGLIATGGDRTVDVDLQKSTGAAAFATILSSTIHFTNGSVLRTVSAGTLSSASLVAGDILRIIITVAGAAGNQAQGLMVTVTLTEAP